MERRGIRVNLNNSNFNGVATRNNAATFDRQSHVMDLKRLSSRIMCSDNITRQGLNKKPSVPTATVTTEDDDEFFNKIKSEIDKNLRSHSKEYHKANINYQSTDLLRKKRPIIDVETQNIIKRFKKDANYINSMQSSNNMNITQFNHIDTDMKENCNVSIDNITSNNNNDVQRKNMFPPNILNISSRIPANKYVFQATSKLHTNVLSSPINKNEIAILHEEYEKSFFYEMMFLTPPNSIEEDVDL
ncbi:hypothetical protein K0M31_018129 [Melipona bicolor]|uniref:Uncharacterized protein n=1 Tax=Melipona bicolor TaxID=60889 RepID=A0AA40KE12_9HYME|nr:hypothetical protein K0M31_018129 [Melipona bicolor]